MIFSYKCTDSEWVLCSRLLQTSFPKAQCVLGQSPGPRALAGARYLAALTRTDLHVTTEETKPKCYKSFIIT